MGGTPDGQLRIVMTVQHVVGDKGSQCYVHVGDKWRYQGTVVGADRQSDAAMVLIRGHRGPVQQIPNAQLWMGELRHEDRVRTEGFAYFGYHEGVGTIDHQIGSKLWWNVGSHSGMSGGPSYLVGNYDPPRFVTTTTATDGRRSVGPYRTFFTDWVPTCSSSLYEYGVSGDGLVTVQPKRSGLIEGPVARGQRPRIDPSCQAPT